MSMLGIIGGSGLYAMPGLEEIEEQNVETAYGPPSSPIVVGSLEGVKVAFLARHGRGHFLNPSEVPYRANIAAFRRIGVTHLLSLSAVGSLKQELPPRTAVLPDQIIDITRQRARTFFEGGIVAHVGIADPFCTTLRAAVAPIAAAASPSSQDGGTYVCIEGPQFSTRAESRLYRSWGADIIGMTAMPEARLAREAGLCYATVAMVTDYDVWHESEDDVTVEVVQRVMADNVAANHEIVRGLAKRGLPACECGCASAIANAIITAPAAMSDAGRATLARFAAREDVI
ncbi:MAG TPA: S-methyl-5'-thioadenosine phosphorylase [Thermomicrobiales bacterium]|nr:S-methyl-5'-thioadenosine phosphorylase [Thermomicrobiales bacterium]